MRFNTDTSKSAEEFIFSCKLRTLVYPPLHSNKILVTQLTTQMHLAMTLCVKLDFQGHQGNRDFQGNRSIMQASKYFT